MVGNCLFFSALSGQNEGSDMSVLNQSHSSGAFISRGVGFVACSFAGLCRITIRQRLRGKEGFHTFQTEEIPIDSERKEVEMMKHPESQHTGLSYILIPFLYSPMLLTHHFTAICTLQLSQIIFKDPLFPVSPLDRGANGEAGGTWCTFPLPGWWFCRVTHAAESSSESTGTDVPHHHPP